MGCRVKGVGMVQEQKGFDVWNRREEGLNARGLEQWVKCKTKYMAGMHLGQGSWPASSKGKKRPFTKQVAGLLDFLAGLLLFRTKNGSAGKRGGRPVSGKANGGHSRVQIEAPEVSFPMEQTLH